MKKIGIAVGIIVAVAIVVCLVPLKEVTYQEGTETHFEQLDCAASGFVKEERNPGSDFIMTEMK